MKVLTKNLEVESGNFSNSTELYLDFDPASGESYIGINQEPGTYPVSVFEGRTFRFYFRDYAKKSEARAIFSGIKPMLQNLADAYGKGDKEACNAIEMEIDYKIRNW